jgi:hypothetical protein
MTSLSSSFDSTDRFEMGRYVLTSVGSSSGFFSNGEMNAALNTVGTTPCCNGRLNSSTRYGASNEMFLQDMRRQEIGRALLVQKQKDSSDDVSDGQ